MNIGFSRIIKGRLASDALSLYAVQGINYLMPLLILPVMLRALGPQQYGLIMFAQSLLGYATILTDFGFNMTAARDIAVARDDRAEVAKIYWTTMAAKALLMIVSGALIVLVVAVTPSFRADWNIFAACSVIVLGNLLFPQWYFQGMEALKDIALTQAVAKCVVAASAFVFVRNPGDVTLAAIILSGPQAFAAGAAWLLGRRLAPQLRYRPSLGDICMALRGSSSMFAATISTTLYLHTNTFVLGLMANEQAVAIYSLANRLIAALQSLVGPVITALFPRMSALFANDRPQAWTLLKRASWFVLPGIGLASCLLALLAPFVVDLVGGANYSGAVSVLRIMTPIPLLVTVATILGQIVMVNLKLTKSLFRIYLVVGLLNLAILPLLIRAHAADGAAWALVTAETIGPVLMLLHIRKRSQRRDASK